MRLPVVLILFMAFSCHSFAQKTKIFGSAPAYAGTTIELMYHEDSFTYTEKKIGEFTVAANGDFSLEFSINKTRLIFLPLDVYKGFIYAEKGANYEVKLPPKKEKSPAQKLNPFFEAEELMLGVANGGKSGINVSIRMLDDKMDGFINQNFHRIYRKKERSAGEAFKNELKKEFGSIKNPFFKQYFHYRLGFLDFLAYPNSFRKIEEKYFEGKEIQLNNPAYMSLFKKQYGNFLSGYFNQKEGVAIGKAMKSQNTFSMLSDLMKKYAAYSNSQFRNLIIATSIFDSFNRKFINRKKALKVIKAVKQSARSNYNQALCENLIDRITHLQKNYPAPNFNIGKYKLANYKGKYLYLNFCNTQSYPCQQDFKEIEKLQKQFGQHIEFLSISCDWDQIKMHEYLKNNQFSWPIIPIGEQHHLIQDYKVKAFPTYVLIDPKGNILDASAPGPKEHIQMQFIKIARDAARKEYQK